MRVSVKKLLHDVLVLADKYPEPYTYAVLIQATMAAREAAYEAAPEIRVVHVTDPGSEIIADMERDEPISEIRRKFIIFFQSVWKQVNRAAKTMSKDASKKFLKRTTELFWNTAAEEDKKAQAHSEGRRYGAFWMPFLVGATALGGIFAYSSGKSTKEYIEKKESQISPVVYAGIGAAAVLGIAVLLRR